MIKTLNEELNDWLDSDFSAFALAKCLGIMDENTNFPKKAKHVFWTNNPLGNMLHQTLEHLVELGFLEKDEELDAFRWKKDFNWDDRY